jgi:chorismate mutase / prephenate dehydratase
MIDEYRSQIDVIDGELLLLLNRRAKLAAQLGTLKAAAGMPRRDKARECQVLARALLANQGPLDGRAITKLFVCIISESRRAQESHNS